MGVRRLQIYYGHFEGVRGWGIGLAARARRPKKNEERRVRKGERETLVKTSYFCPSGAPRACSGWRGRGNLYDRGRCQYTYTHGIRKLIRYTHASTLPNTHTHEGTHTHTTIYDTNMCRCVCVHFCNKGTVSGMVIKFFLISA